MKAVTAWALAALTAVAAAAAPTTAPAEIERLRAENARLRAALEQREAQVEAIRRRLTETAAALRKLEAAVAALRATASAPPAAAPASAAGRGEHKLDVRVAGGDWGDSSLVDIQKVLRSAAAALWEHCPDRTLEAIVVRRSHSGPIVLFRRGADGEYIVKLDSGNRLWAQMAYQFAHEFCHILARYGERNPKEVKWFEESICETASMFAVRRMAESWKTRPPYPNWKSYAAALGKYADNLVRESVKLRRAAGVEAGEAGERGARDAALGPWYRRNAAALRAESCDRKRNKVVAGLLLELFEDYPQGWATVEYLNAPPGSRAERPKVFADHLAAWYARTPKKHRPFVRRVAALFDIKVGKPSGPAADIRP